MYECAIFYAIENQNPDFKTSISTLVIYLKSQDCAIPDTSTKFGKVVDHD